MGGGVRTRKLKPNAVPSVFWWKSVNDGVSNRVVEGGSSSQTQEGDEEDYPDAGEIIDDDKDAEYKEEEDDSCDEEDHKPKSAQVNSRFKKVPVVRSEPPVQAKKRKFEQVAEPQQTVKTTNQFGQQLNKAYQEIQRLSTKVAALEAANKVSNVVTQKHRATLPIAKFVLPHQLSFIESQVMNSTLPVPERKWSRKMREMCVQLFKHSPEAYEYMGSIFALPTNDEIRTWLAPDTIPETVSVSLQDFISLEEVSALQDEVAFEKLMNVLL